MHKKYVMLMLMLMLSMHAMLRALNLKGDVCIAAVVEHETAATMVSAPAVVILQSLV